jgi:hypothetical protein
MASLRFLDRRLARDIVYRSMVFRNDVYTQLLLQMGYVYITKLARNCKFTSKLDHLESNRNPGDVFLKFARNLSPSFLIHV